MRVYMQEECDRIWNWKRPIMTPACWNKNDQKTERRLKKKKKGASHPSQPGAMHWFPSPPSSVCVTLCLLSPSATSALNQSLGRVAHWTSIFTFWREKNEFCWEARQPRQSQTDLGADLMRTNGVLPSAGNLFRGRSNPQTVGLNSVFRGSPKLHVEFAKAQLLLLILVLCQYPFSLNPSPSFWLWFCDGRAPRGNTWDIHQANPSSDLLLLTPFY